MILVVGPGGSGQSYFMQFLNGLLRYTYKERLEYIKHQPLITNCIINKDRLKHLPSPENLKVKIDKCIYIFGDPYLSMMSHFRMGWVYALGNPYNLDPEVLKDYHKYMPISNSHNKDMLGIEFQFDNWSTIPTPFPILFLDFSLILDQKIQIENFLERKLNFDTFAYRPRLSQKNKDDLSVIYDNLYAKMQNISYIKNQQYST